eukprot:scpid10404/ scgid5699/ 
MAESKLHSREATDGLPDIVDLSMPFFHVADNNDLNEETLDGKGTTHCTNTIVVQPVLRPVPQPELQPAMQPEQQSVPQPVLQPAVQPEQPSTTQPEQQSATQPMAATESSGGKKRKRALSLEPESLPDFVGRQKVNPPRFPYATIEQLDGVKHDGTDAVGLVDFAWRLVRACRDADLCNPVMSLSEENPNQDVPSWSAFNGLTTSASTPPRSVLAYCPVVNASPTELSTVYGILKKCVSRCERAGMAFSLIVFDQAIYAKALDVISQRQDEFSSVVLRLGAFHVACTFMAVIGKRFRDAGLLDVLIESGISGHASASAALDGKQYNRAVRFHKVVGEALERIRWKEFVEKSDSTLTDNIEVLRSPLQELRSCLNADNLARVTASPALQSLCAKYAQYCQDEVNPNFKFWSSYIDMVDLLLRFIRASRTADWQLHLSCVASMLPWCFAYDRLNYARYMSYYLVQMQQLVNTHPEADAFLRRGGFSVQRSDNPFAQVASDQAIEQSINRASKTSGGIIGFSRHPATVQRWVLTAHDRAAVTDTCMEHCGLDDSAEERDAFHKECQTGRMARDERDVLQVLDTISRFFNPFLPASQQHCEQLMHLSSGTEATAETSTDLLDAEKRGLAGFHDFVNQRLITDAKAFHDPLKKMNLKSFTVKKKKNPVNDQAGILRSDRSTFSRIALIAQTRQMDMREVLSYPLGPLPWSLATTSGTLVKTSKAALLPLLTDGIASSNNPDAGGALIIDAMAHLRSMKVFDLPSTFGEFAAVVLSHLCRLLSSYSRIDFVVDTYQEISIKSLERSARAADGGLRQHITSPAQRLPRQFVKFLAVGANKEELLEFLFKQWQTVDLMKKIPSHRELVITSGSSCMKIMSGAATTVALPVTDLACDHEEADTRLLLHAHHAALAGSRTITIKSPDTDVAVLAVAFSHSIPAPLYFMTGTGVKTRYILMNAISEKLGQAVCDALPGFHAFTGCDTTSAFAGRGKKGAFKLLCNNSPESAAARLAFSTLGAAFTPLATDVIDALEKFVCIMYNTTCSRVNDARYQLFCTRSLQSNQLPPCNDALLKHCCRSNYQAGIWKRCLLSHVDAPSPNEKEQGESSNSKVHLSKRMAECISVCILSVLVLNKKVQQALILMYL